MLSNAPGFVFYDGPSMIDGSPILGIAVFNSRNSKTGNMVQTFIIRADMPPTVALEEGDDVAICGECPSKSVCYVDVYKSVSAVYWAWFRGAYPVLSPEEIRARVQHRKIRLGAYGDPFAIPFAAWFWVEFGAGHTGYTHQWQRADAAPFRSLCMASVETPGLMELAQSEGWRTFRTRTENSPILPGEFSCPASDEAGHRKQCIDCLACDGAQRAGKQASPTIIVHGSKAGNFFPI